MKQKIMIRICIFLSLLGIMSSCSEDMETYDNKAFIVSDKVVTVLLTGKNETEIGTIQTKIAKLEIASVQIRYKVDMSLVDTYNKSYGENAMAVPDGYYEILNPISIIDAGALTGTAVKVNFKNLKELDREKVYVLPVTVESANIEVLGSAKITYFIIKGAALVNTVAGLKENYLSLVNPSKSTLNSMGMLTAEALINVEKFDRTISTIMGIEDRFLIRIGDIGIPNNQLQIVTGTASSESILESNKITDASWVIPTGKWVHIAVTYNKDDGAINFYMDGKHKGSTYYSDYKRMIHWGMSNFYIGKSFDDDRWLYGDICEVRVWKRILTSDEINVKNHFYAVEPDSEGLEAYWKFDENYTNIIEDKTGHGNTLVASKDLSWHPVSLPE